MCGSSHDWTTYKVSCRLADWWMMSYGRHQSITTRDSLES